MEKYLYVLVGIIWFVSGLYKAYQKGRTPNSSGEKKSKKKSVLQTTIDDILREAQKSITPPVNPVPAETTKEYSYEKPVSQEIIFDEASFSSETDTEIKSLEKEAFPSELFATEKRQKMSAENGMNFFEIDLRTAFIYAEILGKPKALSTPQNN